MSIPVKLMLQYDDGIDDWWLVKKTTIPYIFPKYMGVRIKGMQFSVYEAEFNFDSGITEVVLEGSLFDVAEVFKNDDGWIVENERAFFEDEEAVREFNVESSQ